jgi:hypothetical protein
MVPNVQNVKTDFLTQQQGFVNFARMENFTLSHLMVVLHAEAVAVQNELIS